MTFGITFISNKHKKYYFNKSKHMGYYRSVRNHSETDVKNFIQGTVSLILCKTELVKNLLKGHVAKTFFNENSARASGKKVWFL